MKRLTSVGELAAPGTSLLQILDVDHIEISAQVQESDVESITAANDIQFKTRTAVYPVRIKSVTPAIDPLQRSQEVRFEFLDTRALPGSVGEIVWRDPQPHIPVQYIVQRGEQLGIFVLENNTARFLTLPDAEEGRPAAVTLDLDTRIIVNGHRRLTNGQITQPR
jgi:hypothetical protein